MNEILRTWPLAVLPTLLFCAVGFWGTRRLAAALDALGGVIRTRSDLSLLRRAINRNMAAAMLAWLIYCLFFAALYASRSYAGISGYTLFAYAVLPALAGAVCSQLYFLPVERRARELTVLCDDPEVEETYRRWLRQWREARVQLPRD